MSIKKSLKDKVIIVDDERKTISIEKCISKEDNMIETNQGLYNIDESTMFYNSDESSLTYVFHLDVPAKVESQNLKMLRRSTALKAMMKFDTGKPFDIFKFMPYIIIILLVLFK